MNIDTNLNVDEYLHGLFTQFDEGNLSGIDAFLLAKKLDQIVKGIKEHEDIKEDCMAEIAKYGKGEKCTSFGYEFKTMNRRHYKYDFDYYTDIKKKLKSLEDQSKALLNSGTPSSFIPDENGELQEIKAADVSYSESVVVSKLRE